MSSASDFHELLSKLDEIDREVTSKNAALSAAIEKLRGMQREVAAETSGIDKLLLERVEVIGKIKVKMEVLVAPKEGAFPEREYDASLLPILFSKIEVLDLDIRCINCCKSWEIYYVGDLVQKTERELSRTRHLGRKSLNLIKMMLEVKGLSLGMIVRNWVRPEE
ncbi:MAG: DNA-directed RNA polymerase subunit alpha C-terminal domain-containing protein [Minisyncoccia bacterium]